MNKIYKIIFSFFIFSIFLSISAEEFDGPDLIVCVNTSMVIKKIPEFIAAQKELKIFTDMHNLEFNKILTSFQKKSLKYEEESSHKSENENKKRTEELLTLKKKVEEFQKNLSEELEKKQNNFIIPIYRKLEAAIRKVVYYNNFILRVDDCSAGKGVILNQGIDITNDVLRELGIEVD